ncbi:MAG TPA: heparin lyase I family protein [Burkholderiales bacterium]|nr:heparin lyase I family protein [Burkholderiales bacterium]
MAVCPIHEPFIALALIGALLLPAASGAEEEREQRAPHILWSAGMETGDLSEWSEEVNTGDADSSAVRAATEGIPPRRGEWLLKQSVTGIAGGTRLARYPEVAALAQEGKAFYVSWWDYFPARISFASTDFFTTFDVLSRDADGLAQPVWGLFFQPTDFSLLLVWSPNGLAPAEGPHAGESGPKVYFSTTPVPVGEWIFFEVRIKPAADFSGALKVWMNGERLFHLTDVKTRFPDIGLGGFMWLNHAAYGSGLSPLPATHYLDDVTISRRRLHHRHHRWRDEDDADDD